MTLYVESNFVIELALGQQEAQSADSLLSAAERGQYELAIPAFSLSEPFATVTYRNRNLESLRKQFDERLRQLSRSSFHDEDVLALGSIPDVLVSINKREVDSLCSTVERILSVATIINTDLHLFLRARIYQRRFDMSPQDAVIYASVLTHLMNNDGNERHYFANRNWKDFTDPEIVRELATYRCTFLSSFSEASDQLAST